MCPTLGTISFIFLYSISSYNNNTIANNIMKRASPLKKKKLKPKSGRSEPTRRIGQPRLRGRAPGNRHGEAEVLGSAAGEEETKEGPHNLQLPVLRGTEDGRSRAVSFFAPPPSLRSPATPADDRSPRFGPSVKSSDCPPSTWLTLPTRRNGVLLLLNSKTCVCSLSLSLSLSLAGSISLRSPP